MLSFCLSGVGPQRNPSFQPEAAVISVCRSAQTGCVPEFHVPRLCRCFSSVWLVDGGMNECMNGWMKGVSTIQQGKKDRLVVREVWV